MLIFVDCESKSVSDFVTDKVVTLLEDECYKVKKITCHDFSSDLSVSEKIEKLNTAMECVRALISSGERAIYFLPYSLSSAARETMRNQIKFYNTVETNEVYENTMAVFNRNIDKFVHAHKSTALASYVMNKYNIPTYNISIDCSDVTGSNREKYFYSKLRYWSFVPKMFRNMWRKFLNSTVYDSEITRDLGPDVIYKLSKVKDNHNSIVCQMFLNVKKFFYKNLTINENIYMQSMNTIKYQIAKDDI